MARRWLRVFPGKCVLDGRWIEPTEAQVKQLAEDKEKIKKICKRLSSVSWFMTALSEYVARRSNLEDDFTGRFFDGRFRSRKITDENPRLVCGMYVALSPVRAREVCTPEEASHCSVSFRVRAQLAAQGNSKPGEIAADDWLAPLTLAPNQLGDVRSASGRRASDKGLLPMTFEEYLKLLDWCGRELRAGKRGAIPADLAPIVERLGIVAEECGHARSVSATVPAAGRYGGAFPPAGDGGWLPLVTGRR